jgi:hypothetical protein
VVLEKGKISWTDRVKNEEVLHREKEERIVLHTVKRGTANWIGQILRKNCLLKQVIGGKIEGRIEGTGRRGRRFKLLLDGLKKMRSCWNVRGKTIWHSVENSLWTGQWACRKTEYGMEGFLVTHLM